MEPRLSRRTKEGGVDLDLKTFQDQTTIYDTTQTGEILSAVDDKKLLFKIDCRLMPILQVHPLVRSLLNLVADKSQMYHLRAAVNRQDDIVVRCCLWTCKSGMHFTGQMDTAHMMHLRPTKPTSRVPSTLGLELFSTLGTCFGSGRLHTCFKGFRLQSSWAYR